MVQGCLSLNYISFYKGFCSIKNKSNKLITLAKILVKMNAKTLVDSFKCLIPASISFIREN
jgi:hypothetical protein